MRYGQLKALLVESDANAWRGVDQEGPELWVLAEDARVSLRLVPDDMGDSFGEPWAMSGADSHASRQGLRLCLNGEPVIHHFLAVVDGGRCAIPLPVADYDEASGERRWHLTDRQCRIGALLAALRDDDFERYIKQCGLAVDGRPALGEARVYTGGNRQRQR